MIMANNLDDFVGISVGEQLVNSLIRIEIQSDHTYSRAVAVVDYYIGHTTDEKELAMLESLKKTMKLANEMHK